MYIYVLYRYWDTPDNEGNEVMGAYFDQEKAMADMIADAAATKAYYAPDYWEDDMTWEDDNEIHLGRNSMAMDLQQSIVGKSRKLRCSKCSKTQRKLRTKLSSGFAITSGTTAQDAVL